MHPWGLYVHIPYCTTLCPYCDFNVHIDRQPPWEAFTQALLQDMAHHAARSFAGAPPLNSIYFGGGTPSLCPPHYIATVIDAAARTWGLQKGAEITLEANPQRVSQVSFAGYRSAGINRISLGWQSTHNRLLKVLGRQHSAADSAAALAQARAAGITALSLDLIFAVPSQALADCRADLEKIVALRPEHVSLYALTYHPGTPMERRRRRGQLTAATEELEVQMMALIETQLTAAGYSHYEVSNYALQGHKAKHNSLYWQGGQYLGIGPGAHSFTHANWQCGARWENLRSPSAYMQAWSQPATDPHPTQAAESLTAAQLFTERMLGALRQPQGISRTEPICLAHAEAFDRGAAAAVACHWATFTEPHLRPTPAGLLHADSLAALFF
jgi:oxygen-independent coproporphyrinogen-3 oxidase